MIGRLEEKKLLQSLVKEEESQFVAVFGRRRIGKTYLIRESFNYHFTFEHTGVSNAAIPSRKQKQVQLDKFKESLINAGYEGNERLSSWNDAFNALKVVIEKSKEKKKVVFIDELSWMDTKNCDLISSLENFWNGWVTARREKDVVLIVCASATYWMIDNVVNSKGGLHNRLTAKIYLKPFTLKECEDFILSKNILFNRYQILQCYMILGGVPYYWSLLRKGRSLPQCIDDLFFNENALLKDEYDNLYAALFKKPDLYVKIIESVSQANKGITREEIAKTIGVKSSGNLTKKLMELENCGFIRRYVPYGYEKKNTLYQLIDNFTLFYFKFLKDKPQDEKFWENNFNLPSINAFRGIAFERVCLEHISEIKKALGISGVSCEVNSWECKKNLDKGIFGSQIDLLIVRKDQVINLCEMKYSETEYIVDSNFDRDMRRKIHDFTTKTQTKYSVYTTLVTTYGVAENGYSNNIQIIITMDDLFS